MAIEAAAAAEEEEEEEEEEEGRPNKQKDVVKFGQRKIEKSIIQPSGEPPRWRGRAAARGGAGTAGMAGMAGLRAASGGPWPARAAHTGWRCVPAPLGPLAWVKGEEEEDDDDDDDGGGGGEEERR